MSAAEAIRAATAAGLQMTIENGDLSLEGPAEPPADVMESLSRHKAEIIGLLREKHKRPPEGRCTTVDAIQKLRSIDSENAIIPALTRLDNALGGLERVVDRFVEWSRNHHARPKVANDSVHR